MGVARKAGRHGALAGLLVVSGLANFGCASSSLPLGNASTIDREFAAAAITWDINKDGTVTCAEWKEYAAGLFRSADANRDGFLLPQEYSGIVRQDRLFETAGFSFFDANADGRIALEEMVGRPNPAFALLDKNNDCAIGRDERVNQRAVNDEAPAGPTSVPSGRPKR